MQINLKLAGCLFLSACATDTNLSSSSSVAPEMTGEATTAAVETSEPEAASSRRICTNESVVGTRLPGRRVCRTEKEWEEVRERSREEVDRMQRGPLPNSVQD
jgi:hypothetical protein